MSCAFHVLVKTFINTVSYTSETCTTDELASLPYSVNAGWSMSAAPMPMSSSSSLSASPSISVFASVSFAICSANKRSSRSLTCQAVANEKPNSAQNVRQHNEGIQAYGGTTRGLQQVLQLVQQSESSTFRCVHMKHWQGGGSSPSSVNSREHTSTCLARSVCSACCLGACLTEERHGKQDTYRPRRFFHSQLSLVLVDLLCCCLDGLLQNSNALLLTPTVHRGLLRVGGQAKAR